MSAGRARNSPNSTFKDQIPTPTLCNFNKHILRHIQFDQNVKGNESLLRQHKFYLLSLLLSIKVQSLNAFRVISLDIPKLCIWSDATVPSTIFYSFNITVFCNFNSYVICYQITKMEKEGKLNVLCIHKWYSTHYA